MNRKFDFSETLDFNNIDLTAPDKVVEHILIQLCNATNGIVKGKIQTYDGPIDSYKTKGLSGIAIALGETKIDIQESLGEVGQEEHKYECFLFTPEYDTYKYRVFFLEYKTSNYPVKIVIEESVALSAFGTTIKRCNTRNELEDVIYALFESSKMISVMQELIRINQAKIEEKLHKNSTINTDN